MKQIEDLTLVKLLGKGSFGEVYLSKIKGKSQNFATKKIEREIADRPDFKKYLENEINLLKNFNHPNIIKLEGIKTSTNNYYIIMEYINGGPLSDCLKKYMQLYKKAFPEEIVQYLMKQIIEGLYYLHKQKIIHRDLKLDNIMVNFDSEQDKQNLNMMKAKIKIIDFDFATKLSAEKKGLAFTAIGTFQNMDPIILNTYAKRKNIDLGYDQKVDIWSIGIVCYELLIGKAPFDSKSLVELINKVENGDFAVPKSVSKEVISFINSMLKYDSKLRLSAEELSQHPFLTKNVSQFTRMDTIRATKTSESLKKNTIWSIFKDDEKYLSIKGDMSPIPEDDFNDNNINNIKLKKGQVANYSDSTSYTDNQLSHYFKDDGYTDNQLGFNKPKSTNINFVNNNYKNNNLVNLPRSRTQNTPASINSSPSYGQNIHPSPQFSQLGPVNSPMTNFQPQQQQMIQSPGFGFSQKNGGFYQQNTADQGNFRKTNTFKENSNLLFKGLK